MRASQVQSGQVQPDASGAFGADIGVAVQLHAAGMPAGQIEAAWEIVVRQADVDGVPSTVRSRILTDAGGVLVLMYEQHNDVRLLDKAVKVLRRARRFAPAGSVADALSATYLGVAHGHRFDLNRNIDDLRLALELTTHGLSCTTVDDWMAPIYFLNFGLQMVRWFDESGDSETLDQVIDVLGEAAKTRPGSPVHRAAATLLADMFLEQYSRSLDPRDMQLCITWDHRANPRV